MVLDVSFHFNLPTSTPSAKHPRISTSKLSFAQKPGLYIAAFYLQPTLHITTFQLRSSTKHWWFSGKIGRCHEKHLASSLLSIENFS
jgi:hypothetical protein